MKMPNPLRSARDIASTLFGAASIAAVSAVLGCASAAADPAPPVPADPSQLQPVVAQQTTVGVDLQPEAAAAPIPGETAPPPGPLNLTIDPALDPLKYRMPPAEQVLPYKLATRDPNAIPGRLDTLRALHALVHGTLGQMPPEELAPRLAQGGPPEGLPTPLPEVVPQPDLAPQP